MSVGELIGWVVLATASVVIGNIKQRIITASNVAQRWIWRNKNGKLSL